MDFFLPTDKCSQPLGLSDCGIRDDQLDETTAFNNDFDSFGAHRARLNLTSWPPGYRANFEKPGAVLSLEIKLGQKKVITGIATQGYGNETFQEWVTSYKLFYEKEGMLAYIKDADGEAQKVSEAYAKNCQNYMRKYRSLKTSVITNGLFLYALHARTRANGHRFSPSEEAIVRATSSSLSDYTSDVVTSLIFFRDH